MLQWFFRCIIIHKGHDITRLISDEDNIVSGRELFVDGLR